ncbi:MAG: dihydrofolate reductase [Bacteroidetes bacterium]|nr:dihydrofolate reductase [Bacteroidota bacterium]
MIKTIIVAAAQNNVIGKDNDLIWHLPKDLKFFMQTTTGHAMLMGRKTMLALGKPLKNRHHIVISSNFSFEHEQVTICSTIEEGIKLAEQMGEKELFISGGGAIYAYCLENNLVDKIYLTRIHHEFEGDTFFPELNMKKWVLANEEFVEADEKNAHDMSFLTFLPNA